MTPEHLPTTALSVLSLFQPTLEGVEDFSNKVIAEVNHGHVSAIDVKIILKAMEEICKRINEGTKHAQIVEAQRHGMKEFAHNGAKVTIGEYGTVYNYDSCGDDKYDNLKETYEKAKANLKLREAFLKALKNGKEIVNKKTGETNTISVPSKSSVTSLSVKLG